MDATHAANPETIDTVLRILTWCLIAFAGSWLVTSLIGYFHRRAYNLTRAESGPSKNIKPDFLTVDKAKRQAALDRGKEYDAVLAAREGPPPVAPAIKTVHFWSWFAASGEAVIGLIATVIASLSRVDLIQADVEKITSWSRLSHMVSQNQTGTIIALAVIGANAVIVVQKLKKPTPQ